ELFPVSRLGRRDRRPPSGGVLCAVRRPREVLPPAVPSVHLRRLDPPARHGASCPPPDRDQSRFPRRPPNDGSLRLDAGPLSRNPSDVHWVRDLVPRARSTSDGLR